MSEQPPDADLRTQLIRVQARLERERAARRESEDIAEATLRRLYLRQVELDLLSQVTSIANSAQDFESAFRDAMVLIRNAGHWQVGHYFLPARDDPTRHGQLRCLERGAPRRVPPRSTGRDQRHAIPAGVGIPGTAYLHGATWEEDISESRNFPRQKWLTGGAAFAFPILIGDEVVAVMEFLQGSPRPPQQGLLDLANVIGIQLGRVVERTMARQKESEHRSALQEAVEQRTADLIAARNRAEAQSDARVHPVLHRQPRPADAAARRAVGASRPPRRRRTRSSSWPGQRST